MEQINKILQLTEKDMEVYKGKKVIIYTPEVFSIELYRIYKSMDIEVIAYCCMGKLTLSNFLIAKIFGNFIPVIDEKKISSLIKKDEDIILQLNYAHTNGIDKIKQKLSISEENIAIINRGQIENSFSQLVTFQLLDKRNELNLRRFYWKIFYNKRKPKQWKKFIAKNSNSPIIVCSPPKTADCTLNATFEQVNTRLENKEELVYFNLWHRPNLIDRFLLEKKFGTLKIIMGIREPIAQNLSALYQNIGKGMNILGMMFIELENSPKSDEDAIINNYKLMLKQHSDDIQAIWDTYIRVYITWKKEQKNSLLGYIQFFIPKFQKSVVDIMKYPFDKEKGCSVIKEGNTEIFIYQLERLNDIVPELSKWIGYEVEELVNANDSLNKWIGDSYKQSQKEIKITQEYFDCCFDEEYVKHFYSESDIEKFKKRWQSHII